MRSTTASLRWLVVLPLLAAACNNDTSGFALAADAGTAPDLGSPASDHPATATDTGGPASDQPAVTDHPATTADLGAVDTGATQLDAGADIVDVATATDAGSPTDAGTTPTDAGAHLDAGAVVDVAAGGCTTNAQCADTEYCAGDGCGTPGDCEARGHICPLFVVWVCGCDGVTYDNTCFAHSGGARVAFTGRCDRDASPL